MAVYLDDSSIVKECGDELDHIVQADGIEYGISYLKSLLSTHYAKSNIFLQGISKLNSVKTLLSKISSEEADTINLLLRGSDG